MNRSRLLGIGSALALLLTSVLQVSASGAVMNFTLMGEPQMAGPPPPPPPAFHLWAVPLKGTKYVEGLIVMQFGENVKPAGVSARNRIGFRIDGSMSRMNPEAILREAKKEIDQKLDINFQCVVEKIEGSDFWRLRIQEIGPPPRTLIPNQVEMPNRDPVIAPNIPPELTLPTEPLPEPGTCTILAGLGFAALVTRRSRRSNLGFR